MEGFEEKEMEFRIRLAKVGEFVIVSTVMSSREIGYKNGEYVNTYLIGKEEFGFRSNSYISGGFKI